MKCYTENTGTDLHYIRELSGHSSVKTTMVSLTPPKATREIGNPLDQPANQHNNNSGNH